ncbi:MAG TPA: endopeptidase La [Deferrisomatales bacterium]|nr:endopeptidase La [Deferrisomatales bacterium]
MPSQTNPADRVLPLIPLRDVVVFPHMVIPLFVGRDKSIAALEEAMTADRDILLATQKEARVNEPSPDDIHAVGTVGTIIQLLKLPDGTVKVLVEGKTRAKLKSYLATDKYFLVQGEELPEPGGEQPEAKALMRTVVESFAEYVKLNRKLPSELVGSAQTIEEPGRLADTIASHLSIKTGIKQELLETGDAVARLEKLAELMKGEIEVLEIEQKIKRRVKKQMEKTQKEYYLNEQMKAIQKELGEGEEGQNEAQDLAQRIADKNMPEDVKEKTTKELHKLKMMSPMSAEATVIRTYIDWILDLPWNEMTEDKVEIPEAHRILDEDHCGLKEVKERILEYLAVLKLVGTTKSPILCFVGPPGVGKTSLARSVARAVGRNFVRLSLGGVRDEAQIRGHRRTYIGSMPGKILQSLKKAKSNNPVFLLDEVDKMSMDFRGDPSSALLEVLDPEQNDTFSDHYLDLDYDLSKVLFITTANYLPNIPPPLRDRMEVIQIAGYTEDEKLSIAKLHLVPKQRKANGLAAEHIQITDSSLLEVIRRYTREAGVRDMERTIAKICRKVAKAVVTAQDLGSGEESPVRTHRITPTKVHKFLGAPKFKYGVMEEKSEVGYATGLAWTEVGGELLCIEVVLLPGKGNLTITGKLGDVMMESARAAVSYVRSRAHRFGVEREFYQKIDIHIHVPEGAIPKDGPSAGITIATALSSALMGIPVRKDVAMTGEVTLRGRVLPIGGLKEKILAAHRGHITTLILPQDNAKDMPDLELPRAVRKSMTVHHVEHMDQVLELALETDNPRATLAGRATEERTVEAILGLPPKPAVTSGHTPENPALQ